MSKAPATFFCFCVGPVCLFLGVGWVRLWLAARISREKKLSRRLLSLLGKDSKVLALPAAIRTCVDERKKTSLPLALEAPLPAPRRLFHGTNNKGRSPLPLGFDYRDNFSNGRLGRFLSPRTSWQPAPTRTQHLWLSSYSS